MSPAEYLDELASPLRSMPVMLFMAVILLLVGFVAAVSMVNYWMAAGLGALFGALLLPGSMRYLMQVAEWRAEGRQAEPPGVEMFPLTGNFWQLSTLLILGAGSAVWYRLEQNFGAPWSGIWLTACCIVYPAVAGVLIVTHSVVQAFRPAAVLRLIVRTGSAYWYAPLTGFAVVGLPKYIAGYSLPLAVAAFVYLLFAFSYVTGAVLREPGLIDEAEIPEAAEPDVAEQQADLERQRISVLDHAYGFASRGNRHGAFKHIDEWLQRDPHPEDARAWFLERMLGWEQSDHGLFFAQRYLTWLLERGDDVRAVKVMLRCRLQSASFRPLPDDMPRAIAAAETSGNTELAEVLRRSRGL